MGNSSSRQRVIRAPNPQPPASQPAYNQPQIYSSQTNQGVATPYSNGQYFGGGFPPPAYNNYYGGNTYGQPPTIPGQYGQPPKPTPTQEFQTTQTIRNQVNLKKNTLKLVPLPDQPDVLSIQFHFDSSAACRVSTFILASEDSKNRCQLTPQSAAEPVYYDRGLELHFPPDNQDAIARAHVVNTSLHGLELTSLQGNRFPLIIRLETLTEEGRKEGKDLRDIPAGAGFPQFVQSQTTYAHFIKEDDGSWEVRIVKQKIWVKGVSYELQEIYGMEQNKAGNKSSGADELDGRDCVICMNAERDTTVLPCRHMCMCNDCARALKTQTNKCPICRNEIESLLHIKIQNKAPAPTGAAGSEMKVAAS